MHRAPENQQARHAAFATERTAFGWIAACHDLLIVLHVQHNHLLPAEAIIGIRLKLRGKLDIVFKVESWSRATVRSIESPCADTRLEFRTPWITSVSAG